MYDIPAIIFAGGKSRRMKRDKALLPFKNFSSLSEFQHHKLSTQFKNVYLSAKKNKFDFPCAFIEDYQEESSPLVALVSIFKTLKTDAIFVLSVDAPLIDNTIIDNLYKTYISHPHLDAIIAKSPKGVQPLCGIYCRTILPLAEQYLSHNTHKLTKLLSESNIQMVTFKNEKAFTNINHPHEYDTLLLS